MGLWSSGYDVTFTSMLNLRSKFIALNEKGENPQFESGWAHLNLIEDIIFRTKSICSLRSQNLVSAKILLPRNFCLGIIQ